jgi:hypothetical protein
MMETEIIIKNLNELQVIVNKFAESLCKKKDYIKAKRMEIYSVSIFFAVDLIQKGKDNA